MLILKPPPRTRPLRISDGGHPFVRWQHDPSDEPNGDQLDGDPLHKLALGVLLTAAADLREPGDPCGMRDWLAGEDGALWLRAALGDDAAAAIGERLGDPAAWAAIVRRARATNRLRGSNTLGATGTG